MGKLAHLQLVREQTRPFVAFIFRDDHYKDSADSILTLAFPLDKKEAVRAYLDDHDVTWIDEFGAESECESC